MKLLKMKSRIILSILIQEWSSCKNNPKKKLELDDAPVDCESSFCLRPTIDDKN
jgi:hypothetical protein